MASIASSTSPSMLAVADILGSRSWGSRFPNAPSIAFLPPCFARSLWDGIPAPRAFARWASASSFAAGAARSRDLLNVGAEAGELARQVGIAAGDVARVVDHGLTVSAERGD